MSHQQQDDKWVSPKNAVPRLPGPSWWDLQCEVTSCALHEVYWEGRTARWPTDPVSEITFYTFNLHNHYFRDYIWLFFFKVAQSLKI